MGLVLFGIVYMLPDSPSEDKFRRSPVPQPTQGEVYQLPCDMRSPPNFYGLKVDPRHVVPLELGGQTYAVPWRYYDGRPAPNRFNCPARKQAVLQYWIPSLDAPENQISYIGTTNRPPEAARPNPGPDESIVNVFLITDEHYDNDRGVKNIRGIIDLRNLDGRPPGNDVQYGMSHTTVPLGSLRMSWWYGFDKRNDIVIECSNLPGPQRCNADVMFKDLHLYVRLIFAKDALPHHDIIIGGLRTLLDRWRVALPADSDAFPDGISKQSSREKGAEAKSD